MTRHTIRHTMRRAFARTVTGLGLTLALATGGLLTATGAHAQPVSEGTVGFDGDQGTTSAAAARTPTPPARTRSR